MSPATVEASPPGGTRNVDYHCSRCGRELEKHELVARRVQFRDLGEDGKMLKSRTEAWLCQVPQADGSPSCLEEDPAWNLPAFNKAPGMRGTKRARIGEDRS